MANLWVKKSIAALKAEAAAGDEHGLKRSLSALNLTTLGIGAIIGAGFFAYTGSAAANYAGPAVALSFVVGGIACAFAGLCYAEMASTVPIAGSAYTYAYATMGEFIAWLIGWDLMLEYMVGATGVAISWSGYVVSFLGDLGIHIPAAFTSAPGTRLVELPNAIANKLHMRHGWSTVDSLVGTVRSYLETTGGMAKDVVDKLDGPAAVNAFLASVGDALSFDTLSHVTAIINIPAMLIVFLVSSLLVVGIQESARVNNIIVIVKVIVVLAFIGFGISYVDTANWGGKFIPDNPDNWGNFGHYGWSGVLRGAGVVFFAFIGFDAVSTTAQEAKNPQRDMPIGIIGSLIICTILYVLGAYVMTGVVSYKALDVPDPVAVAIERTGQMWLAYIIKVGAIAGLSSVILVMLLSQPRIFFAMSKDGLLPQAAARIHPRFRTPWITTIVTGLIVMTAAGVLPIHVAGELTSIGTLFAFAVVSAGVLYLRITQPEVERPFRAPLVYFVAPMGVLSSVALMATLPTDTWIRLVVWMAIGLVIYFAYGVRHSRLGNAGPSSTEPVLSEST